MNKLILILVTLLLSAQFVEAQNLSKAEKKRIKDELKNYKKHPEDYQAMQKKYKSSLEDRDETIASLRKQLKDAQTAKGSSETKLTELQQQVAELQNQLTAASAEAPKKNSFEVPQAGTIYKVQIGLYKDYDITNYFTAPKFIAAEKVGNFNAYVVNYFGTEQEAEQFKADLRKFGIRDAFVSKYVDGVRVYEWNKNPKYKGRKQPQSVEEVLQIK